MTLRHYIQASVLLGAVVSSHQSSANISASAVRTALAPPTPNILLILTDDQRADTLWAMPRTKAWLQDYGVTFTNSFVNSPLCCPNRSSLLTGLYPRQHGVYSNHAPDGGAGKLDDTQTLATWLTPTYRTGYFGKYLNEFRAESFPVWPYLVPGWDDQRIFDRPPGSKTGEANYTNYGLLENGTHVLYGSGANNYSTNRLFQLARDFIARVRAAQPFFAMVAPNAPHHPYQPQASDKGTFDGLPPYRPPSYNEADVSDKPAWMHAIPLFTTTQHATYAWQRQRYHETLLALDRQIDMTLTWLQDAGRLKHTLVIFTSDNGYTWGEHRLAPGKSCAYEECIRVPLVVRPPNAVKRTESRLVQTADLTATILDYANVTPHVALAGQSLRPLLDGTLTDWRKDILIEFFSTDQRVEGVRRPPFVAVRTAKDVYIQLLSDSLKDTKQQEYYNFALDRYQVVNLARDLRYASRVQLLAERLAILRMQ